MKELLWSVKSLEITQLSLQRFGLLQRKALYKYLLLLLVVVISENIIQVLIS